MSDRVKKTPPLYATGRYQVDAPFTIDPNALYICKAIRSLDDLYSQGVDPFTTYYAPFAIEQAEYQVDVANLVNIVTLMSDHGPTLYVPDTYIASYPDITVVPYRHMLLSVSLGAVPDMLPLEGTMAKVGAVVREDIGIDTTVKLHQLGTSLDGLTQADHLAAEAVRKQAIEDNTTDRGRYLAAQETNQRLRERIRILEDVLIENGWMGT